MLHFSQLTVSQCYLLHYFTTLPHFDQLCALLVTVIDIAIIKLTFVNLNVCTYVAVLFLFSDNRLKVKRCQITSKTKMTNILKFKLNNLLTKYYCILVSILIKNTLYWVLFSARCNIYILRLCYDVSVHLSVMEVHWRIIANFRFEIPIQIYRTLQSRGWII